MKRNTIMRDKEISTIVKSDSDNSNLIITSVIRGKEIKHTVIRENSDSNSLEKSHDLFLDYGKLEEG